jgi:hypothetical protein
MVRVRWAPVLAVISLALTGCTSPAIDQANDDHTAISSGAPKSAEQCLREGDLSGQRAYPLRIAVPGGEATMPKGAVTLKVCFERLHGARPAHLVFRLHGVAGTLTPAEARVDSPEGAAHMMELKATLENGTGRLEATIDFGATGETGQTTQSRSIRVEVDGGVAHLAEK